MFNQYLIRYKIRKQSNEGFLKRKGNAVSKMTDTFNEKHFLLKMKNTTMNFFGSVTKLNAAPPGSLLYA